MFVFECGLLVDTISIGLPTNFTGGAGGSAAQVRPREAQDLRAEAAREFPGGPAAGARPRVSLPPRQAEGQGRAPGEGARQRAKVRGDQPGRRRRRRLLQQQLQRQQQQPLAPRALEAAAGEIKAHTLLLALSICSAQTELKHDYHYCDMDMITKHTISDSFPMLPCLKI